MRAEPNRTRVQGFTKTEDTYVKKSIGPSWFNYSWSEKIKTEKIGNIIMINTNSPIDEVYLNGKQINI